MREDWLEVELGEIAAVNPKKPEVENDCEVSFLPMRLVEEESGAYSKSETRLYSEVKKGYTGFIEGDVIFAKITPCMENGKIAVVDKLTNAIGFGSTEFHVLRPLESIFNKYIFHYLVQKEFRGRAQRKMTGSAGQLRVPTEFLKESMIPLAPLPEQRAIVSKIEQLLSELDNGIANLNTAKGKLKIYRQAVLKKAFEGALTKDWRKRKSHLPTADELLDQIKAERIQYYDSQVQEWEKEVAKWESGGKVGKKPKKPRKVKNLAPFDEAQLSEFSILPESWKWVKIDSIQYHDQYSVKAGPFGSSLKKSFYTESGYKIYGQEQVIAGDPSIGDYYVDQEKFDELSSCKVESNDVLISLVGTIGKVLVLPKEIEPGIINPRLVKITLARGFYSPKFFKYYFESTYLKTLYSVKSHGATMDILNLGIIQELPFPLLPKIEQDQIVEEIESRLSTCDHILLEIETSLEKTEALWQSILKKAFEGELLSEEELAACRKESDWEPAEKLFERIKNKE